MTAVPETDQPARLVRPAEVNDAAQAAPTRRIRNVSAQRANNFDAAGDSSRLQIHHLHRVRTFAGDKRVRARRIHAEPVGLPAKGTRCSSVPVSASVTASSLVATVTNRPFAAHSISTGVCGTAISRTGFSPSARKTDTVPGVSELTKMRPPPSALMSQGAGST
jgi:hypothetical protein